MYCARVLRKSKWDCTRSVSKTNASGSQFHFEQAVVSEAIACRRTTASRVAGKFSHVKPQCLIFLLVCDLRSSYQEYA